MKGRVRIYQFLESVILALMPALSSVALLHYSGFQVGQYIPFYTDELHYWNEVSTLVTAGFHGGYSVINEMPSAIEWSRFGPHGPGFPLVVSPFAWSFGWSTYSPVIFNMAWLSIAMLIYFQSVPVNRTQRISVAVFVSSFSPVLLFLPTAMQESLHQGIGVLIAAMIVRSVTQALSESEKTGRVRDLAVAATFAAFAFIRASWGMIYVLAVAIVPGRTGSLLHYRLLLGFVLVLFLFGIGFLRVEGETLLFQVADHRVEQFGGIREVVPLPKRELAVDIALFQHLVHFVISLPVMHLHGLIDLLRNIVDDILVEFNGVHRSNH